MMLGSLLLPFVLSMFNSILSDDCMSEDDYDDRQPNDRDSGKALDDDEGAELSE